MSETPNHGYDVPDKGTQNWHEPLNGNFEALEVDVELRDAGSPGANGYSPAAGAKYLDTQNGLIYLADGNTWTQEFDLTGGGGGGSTSLSGGDGIDPDSIGDGDTVSVAWGDATDLAPGGSVDQLSGSLTSQTLTDIEGDNLSIDNGTLNASGSGGSTSLSGGEGIDPGSITDGDTLSVAWGDASGLNSNGIANDFTVANDLNALGRVDQLSGSVTGGQTLTDIAGNNLSIDTNGTLNASGGSGGGISSLSGGEGINPGTIGDGDTLSVAWGDASGLDSNGIANDFTVANDLDASGNISDFSGANSLDTNGTVNTGEYLSITNGVAFSAAAEWQGGGSNTIDSNATNATIGGGTDNEIPTGAGNMTIGGGSGNSAGGPSATVGGGKDNTASGQEATASGGRNNTASGVRSTVGGGIGNTATAQYTTIAGGQFHDVFDNYGTIGGGSGNQAGSDDGTANAEYATVAGGESNRAEATDATVAGGNNNLVEGFYGTIGGGAPSDLNNPGNTRNVVYDDYGTIGGGGNNQAGSNSNDPTDATYATVGGGRGNAASGEESVVGGGRGNFATGEYATIAGGSNNEAVALGGTVGGGGGVSDPDANRAYGEYSTVPGGLGNTAYGNYSVVMGRNATANNDGAFVVGDSTSNEVTSQNPDEARFQPRVHCANGLESTTVTVDDASTAEITAENPTAIDPRLTFNINPNNDPASVSITQSGDINVADKITTFGDDSNLAGDFSGDVDVSNDLNVSGNKNFVQSVDTDNGEKEVVYTSSEADESLTETVGVAQLEDGRVEIELPDHFGWVTSEDEPLHVQTTPYATETSGLAVVERSIDRIVVEDIDGEGDYEFSYTVKGTRAGHEDKQVVREPTATGPSAAPADDD
jgi:hypothetical protein